MSDSSNFPLSIFIIYVTLYKTQKKIIVIIINMSIIKRNVKNVFFYLPMVLVSLNKIEISKNVSIFTIRIFNY